ncbi:TonB-linked outer membrane protein, SusC/RagA family [Fodinibius roseus]|uniref:TonB-linked outer membrane protein, SusC/RagA family n=1 Tax=Fodinibius roseus TaxID=1194090 RepID=A0A1M5L1I4_9BACT|nr:TonB-dependent receptor [Fodinibius roseus]SHG58599.1 TonB-linked outer membrane protein, SusC/RagA family [Fodinibius roseus]
MEKNIRWITVGLGVMFLSLFELTANLYAQQQNVNGTVTDASTSETMPGVNVLVKGTTMGTSTDAEGRYELAVSSLSDTLVFSFVGYRTQEVPINGRTSIDLELQSQAIGGEELVVVGYSEQQRGDLTGSISQIDGQEIAEVPTLEISRGLQGKMSGLKINDRGGEPGSANMDILVRGKETLGNNSPLVIIDGIPSGMGDLESLSSRDISSVNVLKDASAAIYGARAANGVILVTTKRGAEGTTELSINASSGISKFTRVPEVMNSWQLATYQNEMQERYGRVKSWTEEDIRLFREGTNPITHPNTDWHNAVFDDYTPESRINIAASGGTESVQYYISGDYNNKGTNYRGNDKYFNRYQLRSNLDAQMTDYLKVSVDLTGRLGDNHRPVMDAAGLFHRSVIAYPMQHAFHPNGLPGYGSVGFNPAIGVTDEAGWIDTQDKDLKSRLSFDLDMQSLLSGLSLRGIASFNYNIRDSEEFRPTWDLWTYNVETDSYDHQLGKFSETQTFSSLEQSNNINRQTYYNISLRYDQNFEDHNVSGFIAYEQDEGYSSQLTGYRRDLINRQRVHLDLASTNEQRTSGISFNTGRLSYFGSISYNYDRRYLIDVTVRRDGSYNFPEDERFGTFPSVSVGWRISDEPFMDASSNWLDDLKIRSTYGIMGNDRVPNFQYLTQYGLGSFWLFGEEAERNDGFQQINDPNPNITWEVAKNWNIGFDASLFDEKLGIIFDYYYNKRRDILIQRNESVPDITGLSLPRENLGKVDNSGVEFEMNYLTTIGDFQYSVGGQVSYNRNEVVYLDEPPNVADYRKREGRPIDSWLVYKTDGIFNTQEEIDNTEATLSGTKPGDIKYVDLNGDGSITGDDRYRKYTSQTPRIQFGFNAGVGYKGLRVDAFFQGQTQAENYIAHTRAGEETLPTYFFEKRWTADNPNAEYPRAYERRDFFNLQTSDFWLYDASFIRLKDLTLSYNLPVEMISNIGMRSMRFYLRGYNLWTIDRMSDRMGGEYYDPEMEDDDGKFYPQQTIFTAGLSINL